MKLKSVITILYRCVQRLLCRFAFPECHLEDGYQVGLPLCHEDCVAVRSLFCVNEWLLIEQNKQVNGTAFVTRPVAVVESCSYEMLVDYFPVCGRSCMHVRVIFLCIDY